MNPQLVLEGVSNTSKPLNVNEKVASSSNRRTPEFPSVVPGPLTSGERALLHAMRKLTMDEKENTFGRLVDENPILADKLRRAGQNGDRLAKIRRATSK